MKKAHSIILTKRDIKLLMFLWRWKALTTTAACVRWFQGKERATCVRLWALEKHGFIRSNYLAHSGSHVWSLGLLGYNAIRLKLGQLEQENFKSEYLAHDHLVSAFMIGKWFLGVPKAVELLSEQELRTFHKSRIPTWVSSSVEHRPDGYWHFKSPNAFRTIALEVETAPKLLDRYEAIGGFYSFEEKIDGVIWLVDVAPTARSIQRKFSASHAAGTDKHNFVLLKDFIKDLWLAKFFLGPSKDKTVLDFFHEQGLTKACHRPDTRQGYPLLDMRKRIGNHSRSQHAENSANRLQTMAIAISQSSPQKLSETFSPHELPKQRKENSHD